MNRVSKQHHSTAVMTKTQEQSLIANSSTKEPPEGHDFRLLNEIAKELLCVNSEDGVPDLYFDQQFNIRFYGLKYDGAQKACPWQTKISGWSSSS